LQGTDSFFPYQVGKRWLGFYGSANTEHLPIEHWRVGLAEAPALAGPWTRLAQGNPVPVEKKFAENPIVTEISKGHLIAVYDNDIEYSNTIGYSWSAPGDGIHWARGKQLTVQPRGKGFWADTVRTPLGLVPEGGGRYTLFYTGYQKPRPHASPIFGGLGFVTVREAGGGGGS